MSCKGTAKAVVANRLAAISSSIQTQAATLANEAASLQDDLRRIEKTRQLLETWELKNRERRQAAENAARAFETAKRNLATLENEFRDWTRRLDLLNSQLSERGRRLDELRARAGTTFEDSDYRCPNGKYYEYCDHNQNKLNYSAWIQDLQRQVESVQKEVNQLNADANAARQERNRRQQQIPTAKSDVQRKSDAAIATREELERQVAGYTVARTEAFRWLWESRAERYLKENEDQRSLAANLEARCQGALQ